MRDEREVAEARLERNGDISVTRREPEPTVLDVDVADGVPTAILRHG